MATKAAEHRTADPPIGVPAEHQTAAAANEDRCSEKRREREVDKKEEEEGEKEIRSRESKRRRCQLALDKESNGSFSFDTRCAVQIETTPKFGSFNSSATAAADLGEGKRSSVDTAAAAREEEESGAHREVGGGSGEGKDGI